MKLISFAVPSYNSQDYLSHCVETLLSGGEDVEILIVNDGSKDGTAAIADAYAAQYPTIVRAIHKENGGHGSGVNRGMQEASGLYYKVVDSDDWVDEAALKRLLDTIKAHQQENRLPDLYLTNFIYDHTQDGTQFCRHWKQQFVPNAFQSWQDAGRFHGAQVLLMHSLMYQTERLRKSGLVLPEHTFYVDNLFAYQPLPLMESIYYLDVDLYHYFIGRDDQSVNIKNFTRRHEQQIRVMERMAQAYSYDQLQALPKALRRYMLHCLGAIMMNTMLFCCAGGSEPERVQVHDAMWENIRQQDKKLYVHLSRRAMPVLVKWMPWKLRGKVMLAGYKMLCKIVKLG